MQIDFNKIDSVTFPGMNNGTGKAICNGVEEELKPGVIHICPRGVEHSIVNTGEEDLVMLTIVVKK